MQTIETLEQLNEQLKQIDKSVVVIGHARPDMDCIGSAIGLAELFQSWGKEAYAMMPEPIPSYAKSLVEGTPLVEPSKDFLKGRAIVSVDVAAKNLFASLADSLEVDIAIDHHITHIPFASQRYVKDLTSVSEMVCDLWQLEGNNTQKPSKAAADCMFAGFLFDTGRWWWGGVTANSFRSAAFLVECGVDTNQINELMYGNISWGHLRLLGRTLDNLEVLADGKIVIGLLTQKDFDETQAGRYDKEGIIDHLRNIKGVEISVLIREEKGMCKVAVRARSNSAQVNKLCERFGGGGHAAAAGLGQGIKGTLDEFKEEFKTAALDHWEKVQKGDL